MTPAELKRNLQFLFYGFSVAWLMLALYAVALVRWGRQIGRQVESLRRLAERKVP
jgi:hypothetical protein